MEGGYTGFTAPEDDEDVINRLATLSISIGVLGDIFFYYYYFSFSKLILIIQRYNYYRQNVFPPEESEESVVQQHVEPEWRNDL